LFHPRHQALPGDALLIARGIFPRAESGIGHQPEKGWLHLLFLTSLPMAAEKNLNHKIRKLDPKTPNLSHPLFSRHPALLADEKYHAERGDGNKPHFCREKRVPPYPGYMPLNFGMLRDVCG